MADSTVRPVRSFAELPSSGLLWLINRVCFHPRGLALTLHTDEESNVAGWSLTPSPDGAVWSFPESVDTEGHARAEATLTAALTARACPAGAEWSTTPYGALEDPRG